MIYEKPEMEIIDFLKSVQTNDFMVDSVNKEGDGENFDPWA